jgi:hypothetical protein
MSYEQDGKWLAAAVGLQLRSSTREKELGTQVHAARPRQPYIFCMHSRRHQMNSDVSAEDWVTQRERRSQKSVQSS